MLVTLFPIVTLARFEQEENAHQPMLVTLLGIVTLVRLLQYSNAYSAINFVLGLMVQEAMPFEVDFINA